MSDLFLDALSVKPRSLCDNNYTEDKGNADLIANLQRVVATPRPPYQPPTETHQRAPERPPWADQIDAMVADMVSRGDVYLKGDTYACRKRSWRMEDRS